MEAEVPAGATKIVVAPPDISISPQVSVHMPRSPYFTYFAIYRAGMAVQDFIKVYAQSTLIDKLKAQLPGIANWPMALCDRAKDLSPDALSREVLKSIGDQYKFLMDAWKAGIGAGMGASYASEIEQFMNPGQLLYPYSTLQYQVSITPRMRRYWMSQYTPTVPNTQMAYNLFLRGKITESTFKTYASYDGWNAEGIDFLKETWKSIPNPRAAFAMLMRGAISDSDYTKYVGMDAWPEGWDKTLYTLFERLPTPRDAFNLYARGVVTPAERNKLYQAGGFDERWHNPLNFLFEKLPTPHEAFYMWAKGQISTSLRDMLYQAGGYDARWNSDVTENWYYVPSIYDLTRIADSVELDQIWALDQMKKRGVRDKDRAKIWEMLEIRPLREEIRALTGKWTWRMRYGYTTTDEMNDELVDLKIKPKERELLLEKAALDYEDELRIEWIEIYRWQFIRATITEAQFLEYLTDPQGNCRVQLEKANAIVELEKAKGYMGYY